MESLIEPGKIIEVGSLEWEAHKANEIEKSLQSIKQAEERINLLRNYVYRLENNLGFK